LQRICACRDLETHEPAVDETLARPNPTIMDHPQPGADALHDIGRFVFLPDCGSRRLDFA
jgi:hypothetical protein